jgi:hypothetical protein
MRTDKRRLEGLFILKLFDLFPHSKMWGKRESDAWDDYLKGVGCRLVHTPDGLLPTRSPKTVHVKDPGNMDFHIQMTRETALKILALGLP